MGFPFFLAPPVIPSIISFSKDWCALVTCPKYRIFSIFVMASNEIIIIVSTHYFRRPHCRVMCIRKQEKMSRMTMCNCCAIMYEWSVWGEEGLRKNPVPALAYCYRKGPRFNQSSDGRITIKTIYSFTIYTLRKNLEFNQIHLEQKLAVPPTLITPVPGRILKFLPCRGSNLRPLSGRQWSVP